MDEIKNKTTAKEEPNQHHRTEIGKHEEKLATYLNSFIENIKSYPRVTCCGSSKGLFCECQNLLIPQDEWPQVIKEGKLHLPFDLDIILDDKKRSSSGFLAMVMLKASENCRKERRNSETHGLNGGTETGNKDTIHNDINFTTRLIDTVEGQDIPDYVQNSKNSDTYLLFPSDRSISLSSVSINIKKLVVLDCKWTKTSIIKSPQLHNLQQVHLDGDFIPRESYFWRWHNAGEGRCSTLEAIYFAALQVAISKNLDKQNIENLIYVMWLFGIQRGSTIKTAIKERKPNPFSLEGKELQRSYRRLNKERKISE